jgi:hypothetical protein
MDGKSLSDKAIDLLRKGMIVEKEAKSDPGMSAWDQMRSVYERHDAIGDDFPKIMDDVEAERKNDFGRRPLAIE